jgi:aryl-alcohol dehydrogenase-like predicted oxidoreductase/histidinol phosphatase-like enzyme
MRLSTRSDRNDARAIEVIHAALDAGATLLDTADSYCLDATESGHNERLIAHALETWEGDASGVIVATKGGLTRPGGRWVPDGRATHLRAAAEASRTALGVGAIELYQLHVVDPRTPLETSVRALAALQRDGVIRRVGLCNVTVGQIEAARAIVDIDSVQVSLGVLDDTNLRNGVAEHCRQHGIRLIAYRPLGGDRSDRLARDPALAEIADAHGSTAHEVALAWLFDLGDDIVPIPGATRVETARSIGRAPALANALTDADRERLDARFPAGRLLRMARSHRRPSDDAPGDVVLVMGMPAAGKSSVAHEYVARGYERLNRDDAGGRLSDLVTTLDAGLSAGRKRFVLDNTYAARGARNEVIECAWRHGVPVRCVRLATDIADAQINAVSRLIDAHGALPMPEELRSLGRKDHRYFGPDAQFRYERQVEPPTDDEGFASIEERPFVLTPSDAAGSAVVLEYDGVLCVSARGDAAVLDPSDVVIDDAKRAVLAARVAAGDRLLAVAWRPQIASGAVTAEDVAACFERTRELLDLPIDFAYCPHPAGPPVCWCRKPLPGLLLEFMHRRGIAAGRSVMVGRAAADRTLADRLSMTYAAEDDFFAAS